jgi:hypothetical protein
VEALPVAGVDEHSRKLPKNLSLWVEALVPQKAPCVCFVICLKEAYPAAGTQNLMQLLAAALSCLKRQSLPRSQRRTSRFEPTPSFVDYARAGHPL